MAQLALRYPEIRALDAEVLQVTHNTLDEAQGYLKHYPIRMPYLCDADRTAHDRYGVEMFSNPAGMLASSALVIGNLLFKGQSSPAPIPYVRRYKGADAAQAVFVIDREGVVRAEHRLGPNAPLPSASDLISALQKL